MAYFSTVATGRVFNRRQHLPLFRLTPKSAEMFVLVKLDELDQILRVQTTQSKRRGGRGADEHEPVVGYVSVGRAKLEPATNG